MVKTFRDFHVYILEPAVNPNLVADAKDIGRLITATNCREDHGDDASCTYQNSSERCNVKNHDKEDTHSYINSCEI